MSASSRRDLSLALIEQRIHEARSRALRIARIQAVAAAEPDLSLCDLAERFGEPARTISSIVGRRGRANGWPTMRELGTRR